MKISYTEFVLNRDLNKEVEIDGIELNTQSDMVVKADWKMLVEYYFRLFDMGLVSRVTENPLTNHTNLIVVTELPDGGQYHRVFTKWN